MLVQNLVLLACVHECKNNSYHVCLSYLSIAVINTMTKTNLGGGAVVVYTSSYCPSLREVRAGTQAGQESGDCSF